MFHLKTAAQTKDLLMLQGNAIEAMQKEAKASTRPLFKPTAQTTDGVCYEKIL